MKIAVLVVALVAAGCGAEGPGAGGDGDAGAAACRAPAGCTAMLIFTGRCVYSCPADQAVCVPLRDGGVGNAGDTLPADFAGAPFATDRRFDVNNCGFCGLRCPTVRPYCVRQTSGVLAACSLTP